MVSAFSQENPDMKNWTDAWVNSDAIKFKNLYTVDAIIIPPTKKPVIGNQNMLEFMKGGFGKVKVVFQREKFVLRSNLAFEYGSFIDLNIHSNKETGIGKYSVTWTFDNSKWTIISHSWSIPDKKLDLPTFAQMIF